MDIHKRFSVATPMNRDVEVLDKIRLEHAERAAMQALLAELPEGTDVVMEATFNWPWIADLVQEVGLTPHLADPRETGRLRKGKPKSDGRDAIFLGKLWLGGALFPEVYLAPPPVRRMRAVCRQRLLLVRMRTAQKNNIHGQLHRLGIDLSGRASDLFSPKGRRLLKQLPLPEHERTLLEHKLCVVDVLTALIDVLQDQIRQELGHDPRAKILMSIPGIGELLAYTLLAEIGEIARFPTRRALAAYAGVLPLDNQSGDKDFGKRARPSAACKSISSLHTADGLGPGSRDRRTHTGVDAQVYSPGHDNCPPGAEHATPAPANPPPKAHRGPQTGCLDRRQPFMDRAGMPYYSAKQGLLLCEVATLRYVAREARVPRQPLPQ